MEFWFSGTFDPARLAREQRKAEGEKFLSLLYGAAAIIGLLALILSAREGLLSGNLLFLLTHSWPNLLFWLSLPADAFLWARRTARHLKINADIRHLETAPPGRIDIYRLFDKTAKAVWNSAPKFAGQPGQPVTSPAMFLSLLEDDLVQLLCYRLGVDPKSLALAAKSDHTADQDLVLRLPQAALRKAQQLHDRLIDPLMLFCALHETVPQENHLKAVLYEQDIDQEDLEAAAVWIFHVEQLSDRLQLFRRLAKFKPAGEVNKGLTAVPTPYLDQFSEDLTLHAKYRGLEIALGREPDLENIFKLLSEGRRNVLVKGPEGSGRTAVVNALAYRMVTEDVPPLLQDKRLIKLSLSGIIGSRLPAEQVLSNALSEVERSGNIVLVLEDIQLLARAQATSGLNLAEILVNHLERSSLVVIATTTANDYQNSLHQLTNFDAAFAIYELLPLTPATITMESCIRASLLEGQYKVFFLYPAITEAVNLTEQFFKDVAQPQKTISVLTEAAVRSQGKQGPITPDSIREIVAEKTHVPKATFTQGEADKLLHLEAELAKHIVGQKEAVTAVAESLRRARSGLVSGSRPIASFLFVGPTGVGKTELAKTLAQVYFGKEEYLLRLDMSEYQGSDGLRKLLGTREESGNTIFINHLKNYPFCLFLLDEFEKASPEVLNLFLQVLEDGRLTTAKGETLELTHTIIIATSNAGTADIQAGIRAGKALADIKKHVFEESLLTKFPPELLNRFDGIILFTPLAPVEVEQIVRLQLASLTKQLEVKGIAVSFTDALIQAVAQNAYDPALGARPVRRYLQDHVESVMAKLLLSQQLPRGSKVQLDMKNGQVVAL